MFTSQYAACVKGNARFVGRGQVGYLVTKRPFESWKGISRLFKTTAVQNASWSGYRFLQYTVGTALEVTLQVHNIGIRFAD